MNLKSKSRAFVAILSLTLGLASSALAGAVSANNWYADACNDPRNAGRSPLECCTTKCAVFNNDIGTFPTDLDRCALACMAAMAV